MGDAVAGECADFAFDTAVLVVMNPAAVSFADDKSDFWVAEGEGFLEEVLEADDEGVDGLFDEFDCAFEAHICTLLVGIDRPIVEAHIDDWDVCEAISLN